MLWSCYVATIVLIFQTRSIHGQGCWFRSGIVINSTKLIIDPKVDISADGQTIIVGTGGRYDPSGRVKVMRYKNFARKWEQVGSDIDGHDNVLISADGKTITISRYLWKRQVLSRTEIRSYTLKSDQWVQLGSKIDSDNYARVDMSADGTTIAFGAYLNGYARVYKLLTSPNRWVQLGSDIVSGKLGDQFGYSVALSSNGSIVAIGANYNDDGGEDSGQVRVFKFNTSTSQWVQLGSEINGESMSDLSGSTIAMSADGTTIAIGAPDNSGSELFSGHVRVYKFFTQTSRWVQLGSDIDGEGRLDFSSNALSMSADGTIVAIGAILNDIEGHIRVFKFDSPTSQWIQLGYDIDGKKKNEMFGGSVALSADGQRFVASTGIFDQFGEVRAYQFIPSSQTQCNVAWNIYNSRTDTFVAHLKNGTILTSPPPCNYTNIEAAISGCCVANNTITMQLYSSDMKRLLYSRVESKVQYFLYGNNGTHILDGRLLPGTYNVRVNVNGKTSLPTQFTIPDKGKC